jgi:hypothetical protein
MSSFTDKAFPFPPSPRLNEIKPRLKIEKESTNNKNNAIKSATATAFFTFCLQITPKEHTFATYPFEKLFIHKLNTHEA